MDKVVLVDYFDDLLVIYREGESVEISWKFLGHVPNKGSDTL